MPSSPVSVTVHLTSADSVASLAADVRSGPDRAPQRISAAVVVRPTKGCALFEQITTLPEYYPTRAEREILIRTGRRSRLDAGRRR